ncbi:hypothetical protein [Nocardia sp. NPDC057440]|uniref:hypothetical protein n=1 Tax=Nocardia sp. NPDC057440 TaxID=3346134 RepID=UPI00366C7750
MVSIVRVATVSLNRSPGCRRSCTGKGAVVKGLERRNRRTTKVQTTVLIRRDGEWLIAAFQNTKYRWLLETLSAEFDSRMAPSILVS